MKFDVAYILARFMGAQFKLRGAAAKLKNGAAEALGAVRKDELRKLSEEIDRIGGKMEKNSKQ